MYEINSYLELGKINCLKIERIIEHGAVLASSEGKEVLLPNRYVETSMQVGDVIEVFVYTDSKDRLVATTERPKAMLGEMAWYGSGRYNILWRFCRLGTCKRSFCSKNVSTKTYEKRRESSDLCKL
ncbi:S1 RNA-binding domain-containing protein [Hydrogenimonas thermophila]|uniref:S1 RNA-binding domain-containing protein n=1 Tax=Hydrogenimonas thermophila TaxID=223786 RepID=UPI002937370E|nr:S1 RNA-binding domain-containing protein [Hydrogenimonas thermophila]WOE69541.1 S1 RNA-binding domain-containing protein [Hydrogenimonas thermophila]WOE72055.1 S1 RNA-binding domain-containing protein [Hydrogenimonas thermophila]